MSAKLTLEMAGQSPLRAEAWDMFLRTPTSFQLLHPHMTAQGVSTCSAEQPRLERKLCPFIQILPPGPLPVALALAHTSQGDCWGRGRGGVRSCSVKVLPPPQSHPELSLAPKTAFTMASPARCHGKTSPGHTLYLWVRGTLTD